MDPSGEHVWKQSSDPRRYAAEKRLEMLPDSSTGHGAQVPPFFPFTDRVAYKQDFSDGEINAAIKKAPVVSIPMKGIRSIQHSVKKERVRQYMENPNLSADEVSDAGTPADKPVVVQYQGNRYLHDGHHRLVARKLLGDRTAAVRLVKLDQARHDRSAGLPRHA